MSVWIAVCHPGVAIKEENLPHGISIESKSAVGTYILLWDVKGFFPATRLNQLFLLIIEYQ